MFWKKKTPEKKAADHSIQESASAQHLYEFLCEAIKKDGRIRVEDLITAAASVVAESIIDASGDFNPRKHEFVPGSRIFSSKVNQLFCGDVMDLDAVPSETVVGMMRVFLLAGGYNKADFPTLESIFKYHTANIGKPTDWGKVPLSIPANNLPFVLPLRVAYEARPAVDRIFQLLTTPEQKLRASTMALIKALIAVRDAIDRKVVLTLALETINGMAKTAPMTPEAMAALQKPRSGPN
jgi:hypothetical protein